MISNLNPIYYLYSPLTCNITYSLILGIRIELQWGPFFSLLQVMKKDLEMGLSDYKADALFHYAILLIKMSMCEVFLWECAYYITLGWIKHGQLFTTI